MVEGGYFQGNNGEQLHNLNGVSEEDGTFMFAVALLNTNTQADFKGTLEKGG